MLVTSIVALAGVGACAPPRTGTRADIRTALRAYTAQTCDPEDVVEHAGLYGTAPLIKLRHWLYATLIPSRRTKIVWRHDDGFRSAGELFYREQAQRFDVWWDDYHPPGIPERRQLTLRACLFAPKKVELIDEMFDDNTRTAQVRFMPSRGYSWIGRQLRQMGLLTGNNSFMPMNGYEGTALLKEKSQGVWQVESAS